MHKSTYIPATLAAPPTELVFDPFDYQGELPEALRERDVHSVRMVVEGNDAECEVKDIPLFIRKHLVEQERNLDFFLPARNFLPASVITGDDTHVLLVLQDAERLSLLHWQDIGMPLGPPLPARPRREC